MHLKSFFILLLSYCAQSVCSLSVEKEQATNCYLQSKPIEEEKDSSISDTPKPQLKNGLNEHTEKIVELRKKLKNTINTMNELEQTICLSTQQQVSNNEAVEIDSSDEAIEILLDLIDDYEQEEQAYTNHTQEPLTNNDQLDPPNCSPEPVSLTRNSNKAPPLPPMPQHLCNLSKRISDKKKAKKFKSPLELVEEQLGQEYMQEIYFPWMARNRFRISHMEIYDHFTLPHSLLLCALETCPLSVAKKRQQHRSYIGYMDEPYTTKEFCWQAISTLLASGVCDLPNWQLATNHSWAQHAFTLAQHERVRSAIALKKDNLNKAFYLALFQPTFLTPERVELFFYIVSPAIATKEYHRKLIIDECYQEDSWDQTPLMWALIFDHQPIALDIIRALSDDTSVMKEELHRRDVNGCAAIDYACKHNHPNLIHLLMEEGPSPRNETMSMLIEKKNLECLRPLLYYGKLANTIRRLAWRIKDRDIRALITNHHAIEETCKRIYEGHLFSELDLHRELSKLPDNLDLTDTNGVVAGLYLLSIKGYVDLPEQEEESSE